MQFAAAVSLHESQGLSIGSAMAGVLRKRIEMLFTLLTIFIWGLRVGAKHHVQKNPSYNAPYYTIIYDNILY